jgi:metal-responsive CopG/Arc/MetJ family transcriptional regulator
MNSVRINISLPENLLKDLSREVKSRKRSQFIAGAITRALRERQAQRLAAEYQEAASEIARVNLEIEGAIADGLD